MTSTKAIHERMFKRLEEVEKYNLVLWIRKNKFPSALIAALIVYIFRDVLGELTILLARLLGIIP